MNITKINEELQELIDDMEPIMVFSDKEINLEEFLKILMGFYNSNNLEVINEKRKATKMFQENLKQNNNFKNLAGALVLTMKKMKLI